MPEPKNPDTIIIKNKMYPKGLTESQVWKYYQDYKGIILNNTRGRDLMFAIMVELNKPIMKRRGVGLDVIQLNNNNYDTIITGRTVTIYPTMRAYTDFCVVDIDTNDWKKAKHITQLIYHQLKKSNFIIDIKILYTGKNAFHLHCKFRNKLPILRAKSIIEEYLRRNQNHTLYTMQHKRLVNKPNIDLSPNKFKGAYIVEGSLSIWGLKCMQVKINELRNFKQWKAKI
jgi:hypothetical protein